MSGLTLSIIVPARNEEDNIANCLSSLIDQTFNDYEVIVISDGSIDKTDEITEKYAKTDSRFSLLRVDEKPSGWIGKNYALFHAQQHAKGTYLLFLDADVVLNRECIEKTIKILLDNNTDVISYAAFQKCKSIVEYAVQPLVFYLLNNLYPLEKISSNNTDVTALNGIFIMLSRKNYDLIGTHEALKDKVLEDVEFAKLAKKCHLKISFSYAPHLISVRMYRNFINLYHGWSKNFYPLLNYSNTKTFSISIALMLTFYLPLIGEYFWVQYNFIFLSWIIILFIYFSYVYHKMGYRFYYSFLYPLGSVILSIIILQSFVNYNFTGNVVWKNRTYKVK
ncbi:MAG: glycosyltransferase family 2 protein [Vampirovibrionia bacterium]